MSFENDVELRKVMANPDFSDKTDLLKALGEGE